MDDIRDYMEGYDRSFDEKEFDQRVWEFMQDEDFEFTEEFGYFLRDYGFSDVHEFLKVVRTKEQLRRNRE